MAEEKMEEITPTPEEQPAEEVIAQPEITVEELKKLLDQKDADIKKLRQAVARHSESEHKLKDQSETLAGLHKRLEGQEEMSAQMLDYLEELRGTGIEEPKPSRLSHREQLEQRRKEKVGVKEEVPTNPAVIKFVNYIDSQGLTFDNPLVKEAVAEDRDPEEALKYLRDKVKATETTTISKLVEEKAQSLLEQKLKEFGLTASGAGGPSASGKDFTRERIAAMSPEEYAANKEAITEALKQGRIK